METIANGILNLMIAVATALIPVVFFGAIVVGGIYFLKDMFEDFR